MEASLQIPETHLYHISAKMLYRIFLSTTLFVRDKREKYIVVFFLMHSIFHLV